MVYRITKILIKHITLKYRILIEHTRDKKNYCSIRFPLPFIYNILISLVLSIYIHHQIKGTHESNFIKEQIHKEILRTKGPSIRNSIAPSNLSINITMKKAKCQRIED